MTATQSLEKPAASALAKEGPACQDCGAEMTSDNLSEFVYGCAWRPQCQVGWHHTPCAEMPHHGATEWK